MSSAEPNGPGIRCPIDLFGPTERQIEHIVAAMNQASNAKVKALLAGDLRIAVATLLDCEAFDERDANCRLCREFATLRDSVAAAVEHAGQLAC